ncbi:MAG: DUF4166 domain-containing protein [Armatimonadota bacterium]
MRLYRSILGPEFEHLSQTLREFHDEAYSAKGVFTVTHDSCIISKILIPFLRLPKAGVDLPMTLDIAVQGNEEAWTRFIGPSKLVSHQSNENGLLKEKTDPLTFRFKVSVINGGMEFTQLSCAFLGVPLPKFCSPRVKAKITPATDGWSVHVVISFGQVSTICQYEGGAELR